MTDRRERQYGGGEGGFSAVEMLVVVLIIGILASIAVMNLGAPNQQFKRQNVARELKVAFERARFDAVKKHGTATVTVNAGSYALATSQTSESITKDFSAQNISIAGYSSQTLPVIVTFDQRGEATATSGGSSVSAQFRVCNGTCSNSSSSSDSNIVLVTPTGTVNLLPGSSSIPTFANANVTSIGTGTGISNTVSLP